MTCRVNVAIFMRMDRKKVLSVFLVVVLTLYFCTSNCPTQSAQGYTENRLEPNTRIPYPELNFGSINQNI